MLRIPSFQKIVWNFYKQNGRHELPWRKTRDPYRVLVSEIMLQQTQVERVIPFYERFIARFPNAKALAAAPLSEALRLWQGLGYNRRAKMLQAAAKEIAKHGIPKSKEGLMELPGIGPYTAGAVAAFAYNEDGIFIETNIRTVVLHHFFPKKKKVSDAEIEKVLTKVFPKGKSREWHLALMDYGSYLKRSGVRTNGRSKHYVKQSQFRGSNREARGAVLRELAKRAADAKRLTGLLGDDRTAQMQEAVTKLLAEGLIQKRGKVFTLPR